jgi:NitT/TauT family transport system substrate-binding protein
METSTGATLTRRSILAAALVSITARPSSAQSDVTTLRLSSSPVDDVMPVLFAEQAGSFRRAGLDVQLTRGASGAAIAAAVVGGDVDVGKSSVPSIMQAHVKGLPLVFVAPAGVYQPNSPDGALVVLAGSHLRSARDLNGKLVGVPALNDLNVLATKAWSDKNGGDSSTIQFVEIPANAQTPALEAGRIDAAALVNPYLSQSLAGGRMRLFAKFYDAIAKDFAFSGWFATRDFIDRHRAAITSFQNVIATTGAYTNAHKNETVALLSKWSGIPLEDAARLPRQSNGIRFLPGQLQAVIDQAAKYKFIPATFDAREIIFDGRA